MPITLERLYQALDYDRETGIFTWKLNLGGRYRIGKEAGTLDSDGYVLIGIDGTSYKAHRLAWFYDHGIWPIDQVDHRDTIKTHNWIDNLRDASHSNNGKNKDKLSNNTSGFKGVSWHKITEKWRVTIQINKKQYNLGEYDDKEMAAAVAIQSQWDFHGEFARYKS